MSIYEKILKAIADEKRLKLLALLLRAHNEFYVCELSYAMEESQYNLSKYLKELKARTLVDERRLGRGVLYCAALPRNDFTKMIFEAINALPKDFTQRNENLLRKVVSMRENGRCINIIKNSNLKATIHTNKKINSGG